jgi:hypothetical protein
VTQSPEIAAITPKHFPSSSPFNSLRLSHPIKVEKLYSLAFRISFGVIAGAAFAPSAREQGEKGKLSD